MPRDISQLWALTGDAGELNSSARDRLALDMNQLIDMSVTGIALVTCHRVELYGVGAQPSLDAPHLRIGAAAASHLLRVAAGLESAIIGEDEVLHQVRDALRKAVTKAPPDFRMRRLFETAIATGRQARSRRTESSRNLAQSAVAWLSRKAVLRGQRVVVAGAGRMGAALAHSLYERGARVTVASRDQARAARLAELYSGEGVNLSAGAALSASSAAVAVALAGPWNELCSARDFDMPPIADISAPQAIPGSIRSRMNGSFLGIDDLYQRGQMVPGSYMRDAEALVERNTARFIAWLRLAS